MSKKLNETTGYEIAGLTMDLMSKIRKDVISIIELKRFLAMKSSERRKTFRVPIVEEHPKMKLIDSNIVAVGLVGEFNPQQHFTENKKVKYWLSDVFQKYVLKPAKCLSNFPEESFSKHQFTETIYDKEIMKHFQISESNGLMPREEILWTIASLTSNQPNGEVGSLLNNGYSTIIGYMLCDDGVVRAVSVYWYSVDAEWYCICDDLGGWSAGDGMLSRN